MHFDGVPIRSSAELLLCVSQIDEGVEALIHPRIESLVGAHDHRKPLVPELVSDYPLLVLTRSRIGRERQHRVLHSRDWSFHRRRVRPRIWIPLLAEILDGLAPDAVYFLPFVGVRTIEILNENSVIAARVPAESGTTRESEVPHVVGGVVPGERRMRIEC